MKPSFVFRFAWLPLSLFILSSYSSGAQTSLRWEASAGTSLWDTENAQWWDSQESLQVWENHASALFQLEGDITVHLQGTILANSLSISGPGSTLTLDGNNNATLSLTGTGNVLELLAGSTLSLQEGLEVNLATHQPSEELRWHTAEDSSILSDAIISGTAGSVVSNLPVGGLVKTGAGTLHLNQANTYSGATILREGVTVANHSSAFGTSQIHFDGGILRYGASAPSHGYSDQFLPIASGRTAKIDTNGQNITFTTGLTGSGGLEKLGSGILTLSRGNTYSGATVVKQGILKAAAGGGSSAPANNVSNPFGTNTSITILDGATLDINGNGIGGTNGANSKSYEVTASGLGVEGYATIWNSGEPLSNMGLLSKLTFNTDISFGGSKRIDMNGVLVQGGTNTLYKRGLGEVSWTSNNSNNTVGNIVIEQGTFTMQSNYLGSTSHHIEVRSGTTLKAWSSVTVSKEILLLGGARVDLAGSAPSASSNNETNINFNNKVTLQGGNVSFVADSGFRVAHFNELLEGTGNLTLEGKNSASLLNADTSRNSSFILKEESNSFSGDVLIKNAVVRMSDNTIEKGKGGTLGNTQNKLTLESASATNYTVLDLHGTDLTIGALNSSGAGVSLIQNRREMTTSTLKVGQGNASGAFAGVIEDFSNTFNGKELTSDGATGQLSVEKLGTGRQILTGINTFTGGLHVRAGELQLGNQATGQSSALAGHTSFVVHSGATLSGNGTVGYTQNLSVVNLGGKLSVGTSNQTSAQTLNIAGSLQSLGTLELDIFNFTLGGGNGSHSDKLLFLENSNIELGGTLQVVDRSNSSTTWTEGSWFHLLDWTQVSHSELRNVTFSNWVLPTLQSHLAWDTQQLATSGRLYVAAIPEPSHTALIMLGLVFFGIRRRR